LSHLPDNSNKRHFDVKCNHCNKRRIYGKWYKCIECSDYNLCSDCDQLQEHSNHLLIRLTKANMEGLPAESTISTSLRTDNGGSMVSLKIKCVIKVEPPSTDTISQKFLEDVQEIAQTSPEKTENS
jgi:Zinc finger, ZZ type